MRCTTCGFPLAPYRTICPRCGAANETGGKPSRLRTKLQSFHAPQQQEPGTIQTPGQEQALNQQPQQGNYQAGQMLFPNQNAPVQPQRPPAQEPVQVASRRAATPPSLPGLVQRSRSLPRSQPPETTYTTRLRLSIAALCIAMGGLILFLVYFMAPGVLTTPVQQTATALHTPASNTHAATPTPALVATATPIATATAPANPGQIYIDNAQMASAVDAQTAEPITPATTFQSGQAIYVTFSVHANTVGAACLYWYLQDQLITTYQRTVGPVTQDYSWAYYQGNGPAHVDIYWASTTACTDKVLAQSVSFTVNG
jgi:hypothetical protein